MPPLKIGAALPTIEAVQGPDVPRVDVAAQHLEQLGFESVWVADVMAGDGRPALEATVALATAAAVTQRVRVGFSVLVLPARPLAWTAAQVATLQLVSDNRVLLGVGAGGFPGSPFWRAAGGPSAGRGRRLDAALEALPPLIAGKPTKLGNEPDAPVVTLAPGVPVPPLLIGSFRDSDASIRRAAAYGDGWFPSLLTPEALQPAMDRLSEAAAARGRDVPKVTVGVHVALGEDESARSAADELARGLQEPHGLSGEEAAPIPITGSPQQAAERFAAYAAAGADRLVLAPSGPGWMRQAELVAEASEVLGR